MVGSSPLPAGLRPLALAVARCAVAALLLAGLPVQALDPSQSIAQYGHSVWSPGKGLPSAAVALAQTRDGRLWIGTSSGLVAFDGVRFQPWQAPPHQPLASQSITALAPAADGGLWIGTREGLSHAAGNRICRVSTNRAIPPRGFTPWPKIGRARSGPPAKA